MNDMEKLLQLMEKQPPYADIWRQYHVRRCEQPTASPESAEFELSPRVHGDSRSVRMIVSLLHPEGRKSDPDPEVREEIAEWRLAEMQQRAKTMQTLRGVASLMQQPEDMPPLRPISMEIDGRIVWYLVTFCENYERLRDIPTRKVNLSALAKAVCEAIRDCSRAGIRHGLVTADNIFYDGASKHYYLGRIAVFEGLTDSALDPQPDDISQIGTLLRELTSARRLPLSDRQSKAFAQIIRKCIPGAKQRYRSAGEILVELPKTRSKKIEIAAGAAAAVLVVMLLAFNLRGKEDPPPEVPDVPAETTATQPAVTEKQPPKKPKTYTFNGHSYRFYSLDADWDNARAYCEAFDGMLLSINSEEEQEFFESMLADIPADRLWLGGHYDERKESWFWEDGTIIRYENWEPWFTTAAGSTGKIVMSCAVRDVGDDLFHAGKWEGANGRADSSGNVSYGFICEWTEGVTPPSAAEIATG